MHSVVPKEKKTILDMHTDHQEIFDLQEELSYYCQQDGKIWREACRSYRDKIMVMACYTVDEKESDEKVKLYFCVDPFLCNMVTSTPMSMYWFIALIRGKRYLTNDIHTWPKRRIFKPVVHNSCWVSSEKLLLGWQSDQQWEDNNFQI